MPDDDDTRAPGTRSGPPLTTWALMLGALIVVVATPDWTDSGFHRPVWILALPILFGLVGAGLALRSDRPWWAVASALWGFVLVQALFVVVTLVGGP